MKKVSLIFSDIEIGAGTNTDDFIEDKLLYNVIKKNLKISKEYYLDLVFNGDIFDFLKCPYNGIYPRYITEKVSLTKLESMHKAHPLFFQMMTESLEYNPNIRLIFITGNHDMDITFKKVQERIKELITKDLKEQERILFPGFEYTDNIVHYEHGSQLDKLFKIDPNKVINPAKEPFLNTPWNHNALLEHLVFIKEEYPFLERLAPKSKTISIMPLMLKKRLILDTIFYLFKSFFYTQFIHKHDILYQLSYKEFKKYMKSLVKRDFELRFEHNAKRKLIKSNYKIISYGHNHIGGIKKYNDKFVLNTGHWRDEYKLVGKVYQPKYKSYGYILFDENCIYSIKLISVKPTQKSKTIDEIKEKINKA